MPSFRIRFLPDDVEVSLDEGTTLLEAAREANVYVGAICGGEGTCGKCRVVVESGEFETTPTTRLSEADRARGYALGPLPGSHATTESM